MTKPTYPQVRLLRELLNAGGSMARTWINVPGRRLATRMEKMGLVTWTPISTTNGGLRLDITTAGREVLNSLPRLPE